MTIQRFAKITIKTPMWREFDYIIPDDQRFELLKIGQRVVVPFGKRQLVGIVTGFAQTSEIASSRLKPLTDILDDDAILYESSIKLCEWASRYYHYPLGEVIFGALPKKLRQLRSIEIPTLQATAFDNENPTDITLSQQQIDALNTIKSINTFETVLLHGVTGSGKTEVYLQAIANCLSQGKQALLLIPEISLTPQTLQRFQERFNVTIATLHSGLKDSERLANWLKAMTGDARILIGTRMSVFAPLKECGIIIVDEEHDTSFKQQSGFRYSARDVAVMRGSIENIPVVLGSATPSLESLNNAWSDRYRYVSLPERAGNSQPPRVKVVDIRKQRLRSGLSPYLLSRMEEHLESNGQVLLFLNRRGYAPVLMCHQCGYSEKCPHCDTFLTYHQLNNKICCHHCEYTKYCPDICDECHQANMIPVGLGTEQIECELQSIFKGYNTIRIDRDTTRKKGSLENLLDEAHNSSASILIGTQMIAKGHHFKNLTLVAVVDADSGLYSCDFRAIERLAQLLVQVSGRAGREDRIGEVLVQTHQPDHPMLQCLLQEGFVAFSKKIIAERKLAQLPPCSYLALFRSEDKQEEVAMSFLHELKKRFANITDKNIDVFGPFHAPMLRRAGKNRAQLILQSDNRQTLQHLLGHMMSDGWLKKQKQRVQWSLDVDPVELI
jgi:primosomal protein N' (replication factor Y)